MILGGISPRTVSFYFPVVKATIRGSTLVVKRSSLFERRGVGAGNRKGIAKLSSKARARLAFLAQETRTKFSSLLTLTFGKKYPRDGRTVKRMLNKFLNFVRRVLGASYLWFLEFQTRGAPHIHIMLSIGRNEEEHIKVVNTWVKYNVAELGLSKVDARKLARQHLREKVWEDIRERDGASRYITKYATKPEQKKVPRNYRNVGRFYGSSRDVRKSVPQGHTVDITEEELREWLENNRQPSANWDVLPEIIFIRKN
jgi:hypothetical protein